MAWNDSMDDTLRRSFPTASAAEVGALLGVTASKVYYRARALGVLKDPASVAERTRQTVLARSPFTPAVVAAIEQLYPHTLTAAIGLQLGLSVAQIHAYANRRGWKKTAAFVSQTAAANLTPEHPSVHHRFKPGSVPKNKGMKGYDPGGRSHETRFKKGLKPANHIPAGSVRVNSDGYVDIKVAEGMFQWRPLHREVWKEAHGSYPPKGMLVAFKDRQRLNCRLENLEAITLRDHMLRNSVHVSYPPEIVELIQLQSQIVRQVNRRIKAAHPENPNHVQQHRRLKKNALRNAARADRQNQPDGS